MVAHRFQHPVGRHNIVLHRRVRVDGTLADIGVCGEVEEPVGSLYRILPVVAQQVCPDKPDSAGVNVPGNRVPAPRTERINNHDLVPLGNESINQM